MLTYLCPADRKYSCSWEGQSEDILHHFELEHDDLLHFSDTFQIDPNVPSENRLLLVEEEIYLAQLSCSERTLEIRLRYLGPSSLADKISYNILLRADDEMAPAGAVRVEAGSFKVSLDELRGACLKCTLNVLKPDSPPEDDTETVEAPEELSLEERLSEASEDFVDLRRKASEVQLARSKTMNHADSRWKLVSRCPSTLSLGAISEASPLRLLPCRYRKIGCPVKVFQVDLLDHESRCVFCEYKCPMEGCNFEGQFRHMMKHLRMIHGSTKLLECFFVPFQTYPEAFLAIEEKGIFHCRMATCDDGFLVEARFCGPSGRKFFCELQFKGGKLKQPILLRQQDDMYSVLISQQELKRLKLKAKHAVLTITA